MPVAALQGLLAQLATIFYRVVLPILLVAGAGYGLQKTLRLDITTLSNLHFYCVMPAQVRIPTPLRKLTNNEELVEVKPGSIADTFTDLQARFPGIKERLLDDTGAVRRFVNVYVNEEDIRFLQNLDTQVKDGDEISIIPAIAGG